MKILEVKMKRNLDIIVYANGKETIYPTKKKEQPTSQKPIIHESTPKKKLNFLPHFAKLGMKSRV